MFRGDRAPRRKEGKIGCILVVREHRGLVDPLHNESRRCNLGVVGRISKGIPKQILPPYISRGKEERISEFSARRYDGHGIQKEVHYVGQVCIDNYEQRNDEMQAI